MTHSYCMGVAKGLLEMARQEKEREEMEAGSTPEGSEAMDDIQHQCQSRFLVLSKAN